MSESIREAVAEDLEPTPPHKKEKTMKKRRFSEALFVYCAIALPLLQFIIFYVAVNINSIFLAFQSYDYGLGSYKFLGFDNFAAFFGDIIHESRADHQHSEFSDCICLHVIYRHAAWNMLFFLRL